MALFDDLLTTKKPLLDPAMFPAATPAPTGQMAVGADPFHTLIQRLLAPVNQQQPTQAGNFGALLTALRSTPHLDMNALPIGSPAAAAANPFNNGFFKTPEQRRQIEQARYPSIVY
jgi:hypothetical protein